jgi:ribosomal protein L29
MKAKELAEAKNKPIIELEKNIEELKEKMKKLRFNLAAGKVKNIKEIRQTKKNIAQLLTLLAVAKRGKN